MRDGDERDGLVAVGECVGGVLIHLWIAVGRLADHLQPLEQNICSRTMKMQCRDMWLKGPNRARDVSATGGVTGGVDTKLPGARGILRMKADS